MPDETSPLPSWLLPTSQVAAGMVFTDTNDRVLLVKPTYNEVWHLPGGVVENGESPADAAVREVREELGLEVVAGCMLGACSALTIARRLPVAEGARCAFCSTAARSRPRSLTGS